MANRKATSWYHSAIKAIHAGKHVALNTLVHGNQTKAKSKNSQDNP